MGKLFKLQKQAEINNDNLSSTDALEAEIKVRSKKLPLIISIIVTLILLVTFVSLSWVHYQKGLQTLTAINAPFKLYINAGHNEDIVNLDLSEIDVTQGKYKYYIFCVYGVSTSDYVLQLAHTTNIPFTYTIYQATETLDKTSISYQANEGKDKGKTFYYELGDELVGGYINLDSATGLANTKYHQISYGDGSSSYDYVQVNAEPLYWQGQDSPERGAIGTDASFCNYYILKVSWDNVDDIENNKETDIVYLMVGKKS